MAADQQTGEIPLRGPCQNCGVKFRSHSKRLYCSIECYKDSPDYLAALEDLQKTGFMEPPTVITGTRPCIQCAQQFRPEGGKVGPGRTGMFCSRGCRQRFDALRFDRWFANPVILSVIKGYDEFLAGKANLSCPFPECSWQGNNLSSHVNWFHGVPTVEFKRACGFTMSTGLVSHPLRRILSQTRKFHQQENPPNMDGTREWRAIRAEILKQGGRSLPEANAEASRLYSQSKGHVRVVPGQGVQHLNASGSPLKNTQGLIRRNPYQCSQSLETRKKRFDQKVNQPNAECRRCGGMFYSYRVTHVYCPPCTKERHATDELRRNMEVDRVCINCGADYKTKGNIRRTTCSTTCAAAVSNRLKEERAAQSPVIGQCPHCGDEVRQLNKQGYPRKDMFCSPSCRRRNALGQSFTGRRPARRVAKKSS